MLRWIREKMANQESALRGGMFSTFGSIVVGNGTLTCSNLSVIGEDCSTTVGTGSWDNAHTSNPSSRGERPSREPSVLMQHTQRTCEN
jgi:hypothetical protein